MKCTRLLLRASSTAKQSFLLSRCPITLPFQLSALSTRKRASIFMVTLGLLLRFAKLPFLSTPLLQYLFLPPITSYFLVCHIRLFNQIHTPAHAWRNHLYTTPLSFFLRQLYLLGLSFSLRIPVPSFIQISSFFACTSLANRTGRAVLYCYIVKQSSSENFVTYIPIV